MYTILFFFIENPRRKLGACMKKTTVLWPATAEYFVFLYLCTVWEATSIVYIYSLIKLVFSYDRVWLQIESLFIHNVWRYFRFVCNRQHSGALIGNFHCSYYTHRSSSQKCQENQSSSTTLFSGSFSAFRSSDDCLSCIPHIQYPPND